MRRALRRLPRRMRRAPGLAAEVLEGLAAHDGWAIASHVALQGLLSLFPFLIFLTALAATFGVADAAGGVVDLLFEAWPREVSAPITSEVHAVLDGRRPDLLTIGGVLTLWFSSSGVEGMRVGLNRAYRVIDPRPWWRTRAEAIAFVLLAAAGLLAFGLLVVLGPVLWRGALAVAPDLAPLAAEVAWARYGLATLVLVAALLAAHLWLPAGRRPLRPALPGVAATLALWLAGGAAFGEYLARFPTYGPTYAGFAGAMIALAFLYVMALIFLAGAEMNAVLADRRARREAAGDLVAAGAARESSSAVTA